MARRFCRARCALRQTFPKLCPVLQCNCSSIPRSCVRHATSAATGLPSARSSHAQETPSPLLPNSLDELLSLAPKPHLQFVKNGFSRALIFAKLSRGHGWCSFLVALIYSIKQERLHHLNRFSAPSGGGSHERI